MSVVAKRSSMTFFFRETDHYGHRVRIVLAEKGVSVDLVKVPTDEFPDELVPLNPYGALPALLDRELVLYEPNIMMEYLDERFPHPPLLPVYPVARAQSRLWMYRITRDWCDLVDQLLANKGTESSLANVRRKFRDSLIAVAPIFNEKPYFMSDEFTLVDCCIAPILWRLPLMNIELLDRQCKPLQAYAKRLFTRPSFRASLSEEESEMNQSFLK